MKVVIPEYENPIICEAVLNTSDIKVVPADDLANACKKLREGKADAMIAGIDYTTRDIAVACKNNLEAKGRYFTSCFVMKKGNRTLILADAGICKKPNEDMLYAIITQTYETAKKVLDDEPKIAVLSYSSFGSGGRDETTSMLRAVIKKVHEKHPEIIIDGEMQLDAAIDERIGAKKSDNKSLVAGHANVLICPDLNSGNILYKGLEHLGGWTAAGPILQGFNYVISDLSRGSSVKDIELIFSIIKKLTA